MIRSEETRFERYIGLNFMQLNLLAQQLGLIWKRTELIRLDREDRIRGIGAGHPFRELVTF